MNYYATLIEHNHFISFQYQLLNFTEISLNCHTFKKNEMGNSMNYYKTLIEHYLILKTQKYYSYIIQHVFIIEYESVNIITVKINAEKGK